MLSPALLLSTLLTLVQLNCENLFDCRHDTLKEDTEFLPDGDMHWTRTRYWRKLNRTGQTILSCGGEGKDWSLPDLVALCEVENDTVLTDLTRRSLLRNARYEYIMTDSPDRRGIDVALLYSPFSFMPLHHHSIRLPALEGMKPTRDLLYVAGLTSDGDTLHIVVAHFPSRSGGEQPTRNHRIHAAQTVCAVIDSISSLSPGARIIVAGDMNDYSTDASIRLMCGKGLQDISRNATGRNGAKGTYRYRGLWGSLDHILASANMAACLTECFVNDMPFLLEEDSKYGGQKPKRNYSGPAYNNGFSDHLPLVARFRLQEE
ncbi:MAG: endonuclease/exonuclease/phosphatase family protein [Prevotella sp.]